MTEQPNPTLPIEDDDDEVVSKQRISPGLAAALSIIPGLGQAASGRIMRGFLIGFFIISIVGLSWWRLDDRDIKIVFSLSQIEAVDETEVSAIAPSSTSNNILETATEAPEPTEQPAITQFSAPSATDVPDITQFSSPADDDDADDVQQAAPSPTPTELPDLTEFNPPGTIEQMQSDAAGANTADNDLSDIGLTPEQLDGGEEEEEVDSEIQAKLNISLAPMWINFVNTSKLQDNAATYAVIAVFFALLAYFWNIFDASVCAVGRPSPPQLGIILMIMGTLTIGGHITEIQVGKAIEEIDDVGPRLRQILWPWDDVLERDIENNDGSATFIVPSNRLPEGVLEQRIVEDEFIELCADLEIVQSEPVDGQPTIEISPDCGLRAGPTRPSGNRSAGTIISVIGSGFRPNEITTVYVRPESTPEFRPLTSEGDFITVVSDAEGSFTMEFMMPNFAFPPGVDRPVTSQIILRQTSEVGSPHLVEEFWLSLEGIVITLFLALMATAAGLTLAVPMSFLAARNLMSTNPVTLSIYYVVRIIMNIVRSIEPIIWALIAIIWVGPGPFAGVIALTIHTIAALGKLYSESIENIDDGPIEALQATGANRLQAIMYAVVPQIVPPFVSFTIYRWDINVRMSTIIGAVGGGGIGVVLIQWIRLGDYDSVGIAVWMIAIVVTILDYASSRIREAYV